MKKAAAEETEVKDITDPEIASRVSEDTESKESNSIEVDLEDKQDASKAKDEPKYVTVDDLQKIQKQLNGVSQTIRHVRDIPSQIEEIKKSISQNKGLTSVEKKEAKDELDEMLEKGDWRTPVERLAEKRFNELMADRERQTQTENQRQQKLNLLESNKSAVRQKYPEIDEQDSEIAKRYQKVLYEKPHYLSSEFGPVLAMRDMEDELRADGRLDEFSRQAVEKEVIRKTRAGAGGLPATSAQSTGSKIMLTSQQKEFCDSHNIKYQDYGKIARQIQRSSKEGVEV